MIRPLRIAYFDLGYSREQYGLQPTRYGGGAVAARYLKEDPEIEFHVFAPQEAFNNVGSGERGDRCHVLPERACRALRAGYALDAVLLGFDTQFDLLLHPHTCATITRGALNLPLVHFAGFDGSCGHPGNDYVLLYDPSFTPRFGEKPKYVRIGKPVPAAYPGFEGRERLVFQCSRHDDVMGSVELAIRCRAEGFKGVFAGPIHGAYPLRDYIDGETTVYLGEIGEAEKLAWYRIAALCGLLHHWPTMPFNQSLIEAQGQGTPIYTHGVGPFLSGFLKEGVNGFEATRHSLRDAYTLANETHSRASWEAARGYDTSVMVASFKRVFTEIVAEWRATHPSP